jgi:hypothetical protein
MQHDNKRLTSRKKASLALPPGWLFYRSESGFAALDPIAPLQVLPVLGISLAGIFGDSLGAPPSATVTVEKVCQTLDHVTTQLQAIRRILRAFEARSPPDD